MTTFALLIGILGSLLLGAMSPGPSFVLVSRTALATSRRAGLAAALGMGAGGFVFALLALLGLVALLQNVEWLYLALRIAGGLYLIYLAAKIWLGAKEPLAIELDGSAQKNSLMRAFYLGFVTQVANPKTAVVYASIFAVFLPANPSMLFLFVLPPAVFLVETAWYAVVAVVFSARTPRDVYLNSKRWIDRTASAVLGVLGGRLIADSLR